jgi:hypothetical protein
MYVSKMLTLPDVFENWDAPPELEEYWRNFPYFIGLSLVL